MSAFTPRYLSGLGVNPCTGFHDAGLFKIFSKDIAPGFMAPSEILRRISRRGKNICFTTFMTRHNPEIFIYKKLKVSSLLNQGLGWS
jgi:hypothetical protein